MEFVGVSVSEAHLVELLDKIYNCTVCHAVNHLKLLFCVFLCHALIRKWFTGKLKMSTMDSLLPWWHHYLQCCLTHSCASSGESELICCCHLYLTVLVLKSLVDSYSSHGKTMVSIFPLATISSHSHHNPLHFSSDRMPGVFVVMWPFCVHNYR